MSVSLIQSIKRRWNRIVIHDFQCFSTSKTADCDSIDKLIENPMTSPGLEVSMKCTKSSPDMNILSTRGDSNHERTRAYMNLYPEKGTSNCKQSYRAKPSLSTPNPCQNQHRQYENLVSSGPNRGTLALSDDLSLIYMGLDYSTGEGKPVINPRINNNYHNYNNINVINNNNNSREISYAQLDLTYMRKHSSPCLPIHRSLSMSHDRLPSEIGYVELDFPTMKALAQTAEEASLWQNSKTSAPLVKEVKRTSSLSKIKHSFSKPLRLLSKRSPSE